MNNYFVKVKDDHGFNYFINIKQIVSILPLNDYDEYRIDFANREFIFISSAEYEEKLKTHVEG